MSATTTLTLTGFLLARIAEDEDRFQRSTITGGTDGDAATFARRVLADCEAKRRIVEIHADLNAVWQDGSDDVPSVCTACQDRVRHDAARWPCDTLRALAAVYADHPDYRDEWR